MTSPTPRTGSGTSYRGHCLCGDIRFRLDSEPVALCCCHCRSCQLACGAPFVAWGTVPRHHLVMLKGQLAIVRSSPGIERGFCGHCGSSLSYWNRDCGDDIDIVLSALDNSAGLRPSRHIWMRDAQPWLRLDDGLPQFPGKSDPP